MAPRGRRGGGRAGRSGRRRGRCPPGPGGGRGLKVGITLPQFTDSPEPAVEAARRAEALSIDGVFVFDHLWPIGRPDRPALHGATLLAALAVETDRVSVGTLVARVRLLPDAVLHQVFTTLQRMAGARLIAGLGAGDHISRAENLAYGVPFGPVDERLASLAECCRRLRSARIETWVGGRGARTLAVGRAEADAVNLWDADVPSLAAEVERSAGVAVTWGGRLDVSDAPATRAFLRSLADAGATWAVVAPLGVPWPDAVDATAGAVEALS